MKRIATAIALTGIVGLSACSGYSNDEVAGALVGAGVGTVTAKMLGADDNWTVIAALGGVAAGTMVARNQQQNTCAYSNGDGTYYTAPCP
ncbi:glucose-6-phosphate isomerase [Pseudoruegeria sp. HB172150]|uniref:glucose-6-phosphate isomerase n=1 Tax=Pseudoruegeria sp. HB172150 TaxID=2721164 RepID=UPI001553EE4C|nr:glucose-6-phosphate isomerase [Pseudoruegeria sp. HB172150]